MIPDKTGYWWYEDRQDDHGQKSIAYVGAHPDKRLGLRAATVFEDGNHPLDSPLFSKWLGPVVDPFADVVEFHRAMFPHLIGEHGPEIPEASTKNLRLDLIFEEYREMVMGIHSDDMVEIVDGALDLIYVVLGMLCTYGVNPWPIWQAIHASNMAKASGPVREDGKKLKPPGWQPPDIAGELIRQGWTPPDGV